MSHAHSLDIISCLQAQRNNDRLRDECAQLKKTNADLLRTLLKSQQEVTKQVVLNKKLQGAFSAGARRRDDAGVGSGHRTADGGAVCRASQCSHRAVDSTAAEHFAAVRVRLEKERRKTTSQAQRVANLEALLQESDVKLQLSQDHCQQLAAGNSQLQTQLDVALQEKSQLGARLLEKRERPAPAARALQELARVTRHRDRAIQEREKLRAELSVLDKDFFQEIEDMKYSLQQSVHLNRAYERALRQVCQKYRLPFPDVAEPPATTVHHH